MNHTTVWDIHFLVLVSCVGWPWRKCVSLHESLMVWQLSLSVFLALCKTALSLSFCRCALVVLHPLSLTLSFSPCSICERRLLGKLSPPMLCGLSSDTAFLRVRCLPSALLPLADTTDGKAGSQSDWALWMVSTPTTLCLWCLSERWPLWPGCVCFHRRIRSDVRGSTPGNTGHAVAVWDGRREERDGDSESGLSSPWQTSLTVNHMQPQCAHSPLLHLTKRRGVQHILRCIVGPVVVQTKKGVSGLHAQPSQGRSFGKAGRCLFMKRKFKRNWKN